MKNYIQRNFRLGTAQIIEFHNFYMYDPFIHPYIPEPKSILFKVQLLLDHLLYNFKKLWDTGNSIRVDEKILRFQDLHGLKL